MKKLIILIIFILSLFSFAQAQILSELEKIKQIKLLQSNRDDVRKIFAGYKFGFASNLNHGEIIFNDNAVINISYSKGTCSNKTSEDYGVSEWKVTGINMRFASSIKFSTSAPLLSKLGTNLSSLRKEQRYKNAAEIFLYHNKDLGVAIEVNEDQIRSIYIQPAKKYYSLMCDKQSAKNLSNTKSWFATPFKMRYGLVDYNFPADIETLILSLPEITANCPSLDSTQNKSCSNGVKTIAVFAVGKDSEGDILTYYYKISGGKITGQGQKVLWDLSDVKPGTYTITAAVDDGCGFCGKSMTQTVVVKECSDCNK